MPRFSLLDIVLSLMGLGAVLFALHGLRTGRVRGRGRFHARDVSPAGFWFHILFYAGCGLLLILTMAVSIAGQ